jgi:hypothetical protein
MKMQIVPFEIHNLAQLTSCNGPSKFQKVIVQKSTWGGSEKYTMKNQLVFYV